MIGSGVREDQNENIMPSKKKKHRADRRDHRHDHRSVAGHAPLQERADLQPAAVVYDDSVVGGDCGIDGITATIIALSRVILHAERVSIYSTRPTFLATQREATLDKGSNKVRGP